MAKAAAVKPSTQSTRFKIIFLVVIAWLALGFYLYQDEKRRVVLIGIPLAFAHNVYESTWNAAILFLCTIAVLRVFAIPGWKMIFQDTEKLGQKLEWYSTRYGQLTPDAQASYLTRYAVIAVLSLILYVSVKMTGYHFINFQTLVGTDRATQVVKAYFSQPYWVITREFSLYTFYLFVGLSFEGRSRLVLRFIEKSLSRINSLEFLRSLPEIPYEENSETLSLCFFTNFVDENGKFSLKQTANEVWRILTEKGLRGNFLVVSPTGGGKTVAFVKPILRQLLRWNKNNPAKKVAAIIYDPKAELTSVCMDIAREVGREQDLIILSLGAQNRINPIKVENCWAGETSWKVSGWIVGAWQNYQGKSSPEPYWESQNYILMRNLLVMDYVYKGSYVTLADAAEAITTAGEGCVRSWSNEKFITHLGERVLTVYAAFQPDLFRERYSGHLFDKVKGRTVSDAAKARASEAKMREIGRYAFEREDFHSQNDRKIVELREALASPAVSKEKIKATEDKISKRLEMLVNRDLIKTYGEEHAAGEHDNLRAQLLINSEELCEKFKAKYGLNAQYISIITQSCDWLLDTWSSNASDNRGSIVSNMMPFLQQFLTPELREIFSPPASAETTDFDNAIATGQIVVPDFAGIKIGQGLANGIITLIKSRWQHSVLASNDHSRLKVQIMDEAQKVMTIGDGNTNIGDFDYCELSRSFGGISGYLSQSVAALRAKANRDVEWEKVHGVLRSIYALSTNDPSTIKFMQDIAGKENKKRMSKSVSESASTPRLDFLSEQYRGDQASLSISYTESEGKEQKIEAEDIQDADANAAIATIYDGKKNNLMRIALRPDFWPTPRDTYELMQKVDFNLEQRKAIKKSDRAWVNFIRIGVLKQFSKKGEAA